MYSTLSVHHLKGVWTSGFSYVYFLPGILIYIASVSGRITKICLQRCLRVRISLQLRFQLGERDILPNYPKPFSNNHSSFSLRSAGESSLLLDWIWVLFSSDVFASTVTFHDDWTFQLFSQFHVIYFENCRVLVITSVILCYLPFSWLAVTLNGFG